MEHTIYLDSQATTPVDPKVVQAMEPFFNERFGNPHSTEHAYGRQASAAIIVAQTQTASVLNADQNEIFFTSGATEANNWLVHNLRRWSISRKIHVITSSIEHPSLLEPLMQLPIDRVEVTVLDPEPDGLVSTEKVEQSIREDTVLISLIAVNNEIGVVQPLKTVGTICQKYGVMFHTDAAQAIGKIRIDVIEMNLDFVSFTGHKYYGPMGVGALYIATDKQRYFEPMLLGGGQQQGLRSGTLPLPLCVGLGRACELSMQRLETDNAHILECRNVLLSKLNSVRGRFTINGCLSQRISGNLNIQLGTGSAQHFLINNPRLALSTGSACSSDSRKASPVLRAIGLDSDQIDRSFRLSMGRLTTLDDVNTVAASIRSYLLQSPT